MPKLIRIAELFTHEQVVLLAFTKVSKSEHGNEVLLKPPRSVLTSNSTDTEAALSANNADATLGAGNGLDVDTSCTAAEVLLLYEDDPLTKSWMVKRPDTLAAEDSAKDPIKLPVPAAKL